MERDNSAGQGRGGVGQGREQPAQVPAPRAHKEGRPCRGGGIGEKSVVLLFGQAMALSLGLMGENGEGSGGLSRSPQL